MRGGEINPEAASKARGRGNARARGGDFLDIPQAEWDETLETNLKSIYFSCQTFIPRLIAAGGGVFVNISSVNASIANLALVAYAASKAGINSLTRNIALDYGPDGICANAIAPTLWQLGEIERARDAIDWAIERASASTSEIADSLFCKSYLEICRDDPVTTLRAAGARRARTWDDPVPQRGRTALGLDARSHQ